MMTELLFWVNLTFRQFPNFQEKKSCNFQFKSLGLAAAMQQIPSSLSTDLLNITVFRCSDRPGQVFMCTHVYACV